MKRWVTLAGVVALMAALLLYGSEAAAAVRRGLSLCAQTVIPSLFPFFVASSLFVSLGAAASCQRLFAPVLGRILGCTGSGVSAFLLGAVGGYPTGGRTVGELLQGRQISSGEAERLLAFCNNCGPAFILGIAGGRFASPAAPVSLYLIHIVSSIITAQFFRSAGKTVSPPIRQVANPSATGALVRAVSGGAYGMVSVCAFVVFFQVLLSLAESRLGILPPWLCGFFELTAGVSRVADTRAGFICAAGLLGWGGVSVHCQTAAVLEDSRLSMRRYLLGKAAQCFLSSALAALVWHRIG